MFKPNGFLAKNIDPLILLHTWAHHLNQKGSKSERNRMIFSGLGKPSYLLNEDLALSTAKYWQDLVYKLSTSKQALDNHLLTPEEICENIVNLSTAIDYDLPSGNREAKEKMAKGLTQWYGHQIHADDLIFSVGGVAALKMIFHIFNEKKPNGRVITTSPYYPYYNNVIHDHQLHLVDVLKEFGYRLTAQALKESLETISFHSHDDHSIQAFLFCDPNNPMGFVVGEKEWKQIAEVLKTTPPNIPIILDEAYAELAFDLEHVSLLKAAPELKNRLIIIRSATKGFSSSGERMGVIICFNETWRDELIDQTVLTYVHSPKSLQLAYAQAMLDFDRSKREALAKHYQIQVEFVQGRLKKMHAALPNPDYQVEGTFYVLANLRDLMGTEIPVAAASALGKTGPIISDVDICYSLLFEDQVMISPLSFFGAPSHLGFLRITCSGGIQLLTELMDRLENRLNQARRRVDD